MVTNMKKKGTQPSIERIRLLAEYLGVTAGDLLGEKEKPATVSGDGRMEEILALSSKLTAEELALVIAQLKGIVADR